MVVSCPLACTHTIEEHTVPLSTFRISPMHPSIVYPTHPNISDRGAESLRMAIRYISAFPSSYYQHQQAICICGIMWNMRGTTIGIGIEFDIPIILGLSLHHYYNLYLFSLWPKQFQDDYIAVATNKTRRAKVAIARILHMLQTGE